MRRRLDLIRARVAVDEPRISRLARGESGYKMTTFRHSVYPKRNKDCTTPSIFEGYHVCATAEKEGEPTARFPPRGYVRLIEDVLNKLPPLYFCGEHMGGQTGRGEWKEQQHDPSRSVRYKLKCELRRIERLGRGKTPYASAIREVLWALAEGDAKDLVDLLDREMDNPAGDEADEPYARALRGVLSVLYKSHSSSHELFRYFLRRLEAEGRGDEPFARAVRKALSSNDSATLSALLHGGIADDEFRP